MENKRNYQKEMENVIKDLNGEKKTLLLHSCCAPCSSYCLETLTPYFDVTVFYFNPNINESEEYNLRKSEQKRFIDEVYGNKVKFSEGRYRAAEFFDMAKGLEKAPEGGERCYKCYEMRLNETAKTAKEGNYDYFCSTLSISPYKNTEWLNEIGKRLADKYGVKFLPNDFKKNEGYKRSIELSKQNNLYRQNYCGCIYSKYASLNELIEQEEKEKAEKEKAEKEKIKEEAK